MGRELKKVPAGFYRNQNGTEPVRDWLQHLDVRTDLEGNRIARVLFCLADDQIVLLHGFIKKTPKTPKPDLDLARKRMKEVTG